MPFVAPWLQPPNFIGAMQAGAQAGLAVRKQAESEGSAADNLRLAYDQLAANERRAHEATLARTEASKAAMALRAQQASAMQQYQQGLLAEKAKADELRAATDLRLGQQFQTHEAGLDRRAKESLAQKQAVLAQKGQPKEAIPIKGAPGWVDFGGRALNLKEQGIKELPPSAAATLATRLPELKGVWGEEFVKEITPDLQKRIKEGLAPKALPSPAAAKPKEIIRLTKDGKQAVFDADTKAFIRYAD